MDKIDFRGIADVLQELEQSKSVRRLFWGVIAVASLYGLAALIAALPWERLLP